MKGWERRRGGGGGGEKGEREGRCRRGKRREGSSERSKGRKERLEITVIYLLTMYLLRIFSQECNEERNPTARLRQLRLEQFVFLQYLMYTAVGAV